MVRYCGLWFGGSSYALPEEKDKEFFKSLKAAQETFAARARDPYFPCVNEVPPDQGGPELWLFCGEQTGDYPDCIVRFGPRGGVRVERV